jgi:pyrimidine-nucleoside phosphorylase
MVKLHGGNIAILNEPEKFHNPGARRDFLAERSGYLAQIDCTQVGWAVQRLGAGRERAGEPVSAHAGLEMHVKLGNRIEAGEPLCTLFSDHESRFAEPEALLRRALVIADEPAPAEPLIQEIITAENKKQYLEAHIAHRME